MPTYLSAFMSHAHLDNALTDPFADALNRLGVPLYYDRANPQTGHFLGDALQQELERRQTLFVMVSPASIASFWVRLELNTFLGLMAADPTRKLIPVRIAACQLPAMLNGMWWVDAVGRPPAEVVAELARALETTPVTPPHAGGAASASAGPFSRVVDWRAGMGDHTTITAAIAAAKPGERILIRRGLYEGGLTIDKPLELVGEGQPGDVEVRASGANTILFTASQGRIANLTLRQTGGGNWFGVEIAAGRLEVEDCDISSQSLACVAIRNGASPILRRNRIHDGQQCGVIIYDNGQGLLEDNDIFANAYTSVQIKTGGAPTLRRNRIHDGKEGGVMIYDNGKGLLEDNDIFANTNSAVEIKTGSAPTLRRNRINKNGYKAIWVHEDGGGVFENNDLRDNKTGAWSIDASSKEKVTQRENTE
ncbi:MAG TPA: right-handed parallel beta-helix repeat-containing protein [Ktedonobacterales bacterium]